LTLYMLLSNQTKSAVSAECAEMGWGQFKPLLAETAVAALQPIQAQYTALMNDRGHLDTVLKAGNEKARKIADATLAKVKAAFGYSTPL
ncbi:MAG: tryptophan--tRNA ligase, partial [Cyanobacteria bacterium J06627_15]